MEDHELYLKITTFSFKTPEVNSEEKTEIMSSYTSKEVFLLGQYIFSFEKLLLFNHSVDIYFSSLFLVSPSLYFYINFYLEMACNFNVSLALRFF